MGSTITSATFLRDLVFGFDVGTGSIGYAVRKGKDFLDVDVLICPEEINDLSGRRALRRQRRTLRSRKNRRQWFAREIEKLGLARPQGTQLDAISLRLRALHGEKLKPEELHAALVHLFKRRGYAKVPWARTESQKKDSDEKKEESKIKEAVAEITEKLSGQHPCQYLARRREEVGKSPTEKWARKIYWPRDRLEKEFRAILAAQKKYFPQLADQADWLLFGDTLSMKRDGNTYHVFFRSTGAHNPGVLGLRWPRFDNRSPSLDSRQPVDEQGRPLHVVRKNKEAFTRAQWGLALMNFRVVDIATRRKIDPRIHFPAFIESLHGEWNKNGKVTIARLKKLAEPFKTSFLLVDGQKPLTPETRAGRARYASPTLAGIREKISAGRQVNSPQPCLRRKGESIEQALNRYLAEIKHPLVRHRLVLFRRLLAQLVSRFGKPDMIVLEAVRSLALGQKAKNELNKRNEQFRKEREIAREQLSSSNQSASRKAIQRYRLWQEAKARCPFCLESIEQSDLGLGADIEHLVPRSVVDCNEVYNLTVAHIKCNRELKGDRNAFTAFSNSLLWDDITRNAKQCFSGRKLEIFLSPTPQELIEQKADLQHTAYIARVIRHISLIQLGWLNDEGRDPTPERQNNALQFQVTNGQLTSRLRKAWGLNQILHALPPGKRWDELTSEEQKQFTEKNRGDLRHHALDAMVIACTLPWLAHRTHGATDEYGNHGWWTQDEKQRSKAANPLFPQEGAMHKICEEWMEMVVVQHHVFRSPHRQGYNTTLYAKKNKDMYVVRKPFTSLTVKNLSSIYPKELAEYCQTAWDHYADESPDIKAELRRNDNHLPENFTRKLCFSHFQKWRAISTFAFQWPEKIKIPIKNIRLVAIKDDSAVVPFSAETKAYVERTRFKEVRIHPSEDGRSFVPVFVPYWKGDPPFSPFSFAQASKPIAIIRKGQVVELKKPLAAGAPPGKYRVIVLGQEQIKILPPYVANKEEAKIGFNLPKSGIQPYWPEFIRSLGHELPHPPSARSKPPRAHEA